MGRLLTLLEFLSPLLLGSVGFLAGWLIWPLFGSPALTGGLLGFCAATVLRFPLRPRRVKTPQSWLAMIWQLITYNLMRYALMAGIGYALFFSTGWMQIIGGVLLAVLLLVKYTDAVLFSV
jgi:hypothetical protein